jgi:hypothetical protein
MERLSQQFDIAYNDQSQLPTNSPLALMLWMFIDSSHVVMSRERSLLPLPEL